MNASKAEDEEENSMPRQMRSLILHLLWAESGCSVTTLIVGIIIAVAGAWLSANLADRFRISENVEEGVKFRDTKLDS